MEENTQQNKGCTGDCKMCSIMQRGYCSSQIAYNNMQLLGSLQEQMKALSEKFSAMQGDTELVAPMQKESSTLI